MFELGKLFIDKSLHGIILGLAGVVIYLGLLTIDMQAAVAGLERSEKMSGKMSHTTEQRVFEMSEAIVRIETYLELHLDLHTDDH